MKSLLAKKTHEVMADPNAYRPFSAMGMLQGAARLFGVGLRLRASCYRTGLLKTYRLPCAIVSIGNITSGGTGKTPMTLYVAQCLRKLGHRVVIVSRGYKGEAEKKGGIVCDGRNLLMSAQDAGDEPFMMARFLKNIPVLVGKNRVNSCRLAVSRFSPDIILLDDGFQHRRLHRDIDIVLLDSSRPFGNTFLLPRGSLRERPDALSRAHILVFTRWNDRLPEPASMLPASVRSKPIFFSQHIPYIHDVIGPASASFDAQGTGDPARLKDTRVFAFSAIANNRDFHDVLTNLGCRIIGTAEFADHHTYRREELENIGRSAETGGAEIIVTTQKDLSKLPPEASWLRPLVVLGVLPSFTGEKNDFDAFLKGSVEKAIASHKNRPQ